MSTNEIKCIKVAVCVSLFSLFLILFYINVGSLDMKIIPKILIFLGFFSLVMLSLQIFTLMFGFKDEGSFERIDNKFKPH